ncbi:hypothetical protein Tco_0606475 [Tanacetum coccineum]
MKTASTPMETHKPLSKDAKGSDVDVHLYRSMIGSLMYLTSSRPDIMFIVCACSRFQVQPKASHMHTVKIIFRYLKGQPTLGLWYPKDSPLDLIAYSDSDYAGASLDRKSTTGDKKELAIPGQTTTSKESSNPLMADSLPKTIKPISFIHYSMADLKFVDQHNMLACLEKSDDNLQFHQIVDFLSSCSMSHALTAVVISESSVRSDLLLDDEDGITCLTNAEIFKNLTLMGYEQLSTKFTFQKGSFSPQWKFMIHTILHCISSKPTGWNEFSTNLASAVICLAKSQKFNFSKLIFDGMLRNFDSKKFLMYPSEVVHQDEGDSVERVITTDASLDAAQDSDNIFKTQSTAMPNVDIPQGMDTGGSPRHQDTMVGVLDLEKGKEAQDVEILKLKQRVKKLERQSKSSISHPRRRTYRQIESSDDVWDEEDASKQGRNQDKTKPMFKKSNFDELHDDVQDAQEEIVNVASIGVSTVSTPVTTAGVTINIAEPKTPPTTTTVFDDEDVTMTMAQTLIKMKQQKSKEKGVAITDVEDTSQHIRLVRSMTTLQPLPTIDPKDKGKGVLVEETKKSHKVKRRDQGDLQVQADVEMAHIDADALFAAKLQQEERDQFTIKERAKFLVETIEAQRKFRAAQRATEIRSKPPTKTQLRNMMMTYLKNMEAKKSEEFESERRPARGRRRKTLARKRTGTKLDKDSAKRQKLKNDAEEQESAKSDDEETTDYEQEKEKLRLSLRIVPNDDDEVYYEPLSRKFPIVDFEYQLLGRMEEKDRDVYKLTYADGSSSYHRSIQAFLRRLNRQDLNNLYSLVQESFRDHPLKGHNLVLWGDLRMIYEPYENNELWIYQLEWKLLRWKLHQNCGVHALFLEGTPMEINMLVEKKYPLIKELLEKMLNLQLEAEEESTMAFELIKFIKSLLEE